MFLGASRPLPKKKALSRAKHYQYRLSPAKIEGSEIKLLTLKVKKTFINESLLQAMNALWEKESL